MAARLNAHAIPPGVRAALQEYLEAERQATLSALAVEMDSSKLRILQGRAQFQDKMLKVLDV